mmetsp:Transcript_39777/g.67809  ORF Transcript_39777/g.67809 Transcript_39777/m.67809 type:complete len:141 (+) Transcript_39777:188-610(+)
MATEEDLLAGAPPAMEKIHHSGDSRASTTRYSKECKGNTRCQWGDCHKRRGFYLEATICPCTDGNSSTNKCWGATKCNVHSMGQAPALGTTMHSRQKWTSAARFASHFPPRWLWCEEYAISNTNDVQRKRGSPTQLWTEA